LISSAVTTATIATDMRLITPPPSGEAEIASGIVNPKVVSRKLLRFPDHAISTAATATPYSTMRFQPRIQATDSPIVA
jgi:hypothetical protein